MDPLDAGAAVCIISDLDLHQPRFPRPETMMSTFLAGTRRRGFLGGIAAGAATLVLGRWSTADAEVAGLLENTAMADEWIGKIKGKYRQVFDVTGHDNAFGAAYPLNFINTTKEATNTSDANIT